MLLDAKPIPQRDTAMHRVDKELRAGAVSPALHHCMVQMSQRSQNAASWQSTELERLPPG